jgi:nitronate monooxygenase
MSNALRRLLGTEVPLLQAPMAGVSTPALAAAVSRAGGLGAIAVGALSASAADTAIREASQAGAAPLNVNVFTHTRPRRDATREAAWLQTLNPLFERFATPPPRALAEIYRTFDDQPELLDVLLQHRPEVVSFHCGLPAPAAVTALKRAGICLLATATSLDEARRIAAAGMDAVVAQGFEAGGHRGHFGDGPDERLPTLALVARIAGAVGLPVLAAGGSADGAGLAAALAAGAAGVQIGTAFAGGPASAAPAPYRGLLARGDASVIMTTLFSGRPARGFANALTAALAGHEPMVPAYPIAYDAAKRLAAAALDQGDAGFSAMWAGLGPRRPSRPAADLVRLLRAELADALAPRRR